MSLSPLEQQISLSTSGSGPAGQGTHSLWVRYLSQRLVDAFLPRGRLRRRKVLWAVCHGVRIPALHTMA
jgi:hypothetical protein